MQKHCNIQITNIALFLLIVWFPLSIKATDDVDGDGIPDIRDNCIKVANSKQRDSDGDSFGNLCDGDLNNDNSTSFSDLQLLKSAHRIRLGYADYNPHADFNGDNKINSIDLGIFKKLFGKPPGPSGKNGSGSGQRILLIVNENDENAIRVANAYQKTKNIPLNNILFYNSTTYKGRTKINISETQVDDLLIFVEKVINIHGLKEQIDYIATIGLANGFTVDNAFNRVRKMQSISYALMQLTQYRSGIEPIELGSKDTQLYQRSESGSHSELDYSEGDNYAIHHSQFYNNNKYYLAGMLGYTGQFGIPADALIANLTRTANSDGLRPKGTIYFEENDNIRSNTREPQWFNVQKELDTRGIPWVEESKTPGATPLNRNDILGTIVGASNPVLPNGSNYLPGSWGDSLTSLAAAFNTVSQKKATDFLLAGAGATSGSVSEPFAIADRFPDASIHLFIQDGSTLGEAYYKAVKQPVILSFMGDLLAQPFADLAEIFILSAPDTNKVLTGSISLKVKAKVTNPAHKSDISEIKLYINGLLSQSTSKAKTKFNIDTTHLSDGEHIFRIVAVNNTSSKSESYAILNYTIDNYGRSVSINDNNIVVNNGLSTSFRVDSKAGKGQITRIEIRHLNRVIAQTNDSGSRTVDLSTVIFRIESSVLAYGRNMIVPVAIFSDEQEVRGKPISITRNFIAKPGAIPTPLGNRIPGVHVEYFLGKGRASIAESDFTGEADIDGVFSTALIKNPESSALGTKNTLEGSAVGNHLTSELDGLGIRIKGKFQVKSNEIGEYAFNLYRCNDSVRLNIDGVELIDYDDATSGLSHIANTQGLIFLDEGEHSFEYLAANRVLSTDKSSALFFDIAIYMRGPDGITRAIDDTILYSTSSNQETIRE